MSAPRPRRPGVSGGLARDVGRGVGRGVGGSAPRRSQSANVIPAVAVSDPSGPIRYPS